MHEELASCRAALAAAAQQRQSDAALLQQAQTQLRQAQSQASIAENDAGALRHELEAEQAKRCNVEGASQSHVLQAQQAQALAAGARMKLAKTEGDALRERQRAEIAERAAADAVAHVAAAEAEATHAANALRGFKQQLEAEQLARTAAERQAQLSSEKLEAALKTCKQATDECGRVRRRNEQLEREVAALKQRLGEELGGCGCGGGADGVGGAGGLGEVFENLESMEQTMLRSVVGEGARSRTDTK